MAILRGAFKSLLILGTHFIVLLPLGTHKEIEVITTLPVPCLDYDEAYWRAMDKALSNLVGFDIDLPKRAHDITDYELKRYFDGCTKHVMKNSNLALKRRGAMNIIEKVGETLRLNKIFVRNPVVFSESLTEFACASYDIGVLIAMKKEPWLFYKYKYRKIHVHEVIVPLLKACYMGLGGWPNEQSKSDVIRAKYAALKKLAIPAD